MPSTISMLVTPRDLAAYQRWCWTQSRRLSSSRTWRISAAGICTGSVIFLCTVFLFLDQLEPVEAAGGQRQQIRQLADARKPRAPEQLDRVTAFIRTEVEFDGLRAARDVVHAQ